MLRPLYQIFLRAGALCLSIFTLLNFLGGLISPAFNANEWWIMVPRPLQSILNLLTIPFTIALAAFAFAPQMNYTRRHITRALFLAFGLVTLWNTAVFFLLNATGYIHSTIPIPLSAII